ncbi:hypothetical protein OQA88_4995 [Cercophora sp. LCS_1]
MSTTGLIPNWYPPSQENYNLIISLWKWYPLFCSTQWLTTWYGMGKTSVTSRLNLPGRVGWLTMECPGFLTLLYTVNSLSQGNLPWQNQVLAALFVIHYAYRAILFPLIQPSMSPIHVTIWASAIMFQVTNGLCIGSWLAAYGPTTAEQWRETASVGQFALGVGLFYVGLAANYYHDDELREIRRREMRRKEKKARENGVDVGKVDKHYEIPEAGLFKVVLYPHYFVEWVEWFGFWMAGGWGFIPARCFFLNEVAAMLPRAVRGRQWYADKFGEERIKGRWAVVPGVW